MPMQATTTQPLFSAKLTPHRSLDARGKRIVIALVAGLALILGLAFFSMGAWPIIGFMGLDVVAIAVALHVSLRQGKRCEQITLWPDQLEILVIDVNGSRDLRRFDPKQVRLLLTRDENEKTQTMCLRNGKEAIEIGAFMHPDEKSSFARAFGTALRRARVAA